MIVPVPFLVMLPPAPVMAPEKVVFALSPPKVMFLEPSESVPLAPPAREPMVRPEAERLAISREAFVVLAAMFTAKVEASDPLPLITLVPPLIVRPSVNVFALVMVNEVVVLLESIVKPPLEITPPTVAELPSVIVRVAPPRSMLPLSVIVEPSPPKVELLLTTMLLVMVRAPDAARAPPFSVIVPVPKTLVLP